MREGGGAQKTDFRAVACYVKVQKYFTVLSQGHFVIDSPTAIRFMAVELRVSHYHL